MYTICIITMSFLGLFTVDEFIYEIQFESERVRSQLKPATAINLVKKDRDLKTGIVTLDFNVVFAPNKPIRYVCAFLCLHSTIH